MDISLSLLNRNRNKSIRYRNLVKPGEILPYGEKTRFKQHFNIAVAFIINLTTKTRYYTTLYRLYYCILVTEKYSQILIFTTLTIIKQNHILEYLSSY